METKIFITLDAKGQEKARVREFRRQLKKPAKILAEGGTVIFPTETVYGLGANALDETAVQKIFQAKGRPSDNPLIVHIARREQLEDLVQDIPENANLLMDAFWPGPLSLVLHKQPTVPDNVTGGLDTVAVRMPKNLEAKILLELCDCPVAAPSANLSGKPSPTRHTHVLKDMYGRVDAIVAGNDCDAGIESTVVDMTVDPPVLLRPGIITREALEEVIGSVLLPEEVSTEPSNESEGSAPKTEIPKAPGMKYRHYAPRAPLRLFHGSEEAMREAICSHIRAHLELGHPIGVLVPNEHVDAYLQWVKAEFPDGEKLCVFYPVGSIHHPEKIAHQLFDNLVQSELDDVRVLLAEAIEPEGVGYSVMNRLRKAASENIDLSDSTEPVSSDSDIPPADTPNKPTEKEGSSS